jgi:hypothetical protein
MANDTVTLELQGDVSLQQFANAIKHFAGLVAELSAEAKSPNLRWEIDDLELGSAMATARAVGDKPRVVERVVRSYLEVGHALESGEVIPFPARVQTEAHALVDVLANGVKAVRFETAEADAIVTRLEKPAPSLAAPPVVLKAAYGAVTGRVQTLTSRTGLRFMLYDMIHDKAVSCYLAVGSEDQARNIWDKLATVEGVVTRDSLTGRPVAVRDIRHIDMLDEAEPTGYQRARGARPRGRSEPRAEERIRRLRDVR